MELIRRALAACGGNRAHAAEQLGIHRQLLYHKLERYGLGVSPNGTVDVPEEDSSAAFQLAPDKQKQWLSTGIALALHQVGLKP